MPENESIHDRITQLVNKFGEGKNTVFASIIGSSEANVRGYRASVMPKYDFLEKIARSFDIDLNWLLTGRGSMFRDNKTSEESKLGYTPNATPISPIEESIIYKMYQEEKAENKALIEEIGGLKERIRQLESQDKESDCPTAASLVTEAFTSESYGDYGEGFSPTKPSTTSKRSSAGKT